MGFRAWVAKSGEIKLGGQITKQLCSSHEGKNHCMSDISIKLACGTKRLKITCLFGNVRSCYFRMHVLANHGSLQRVLQVGLPTSNT